MNTAHKWLVYAVVVVVLGVWAGAYVVTFFDHTYRPPEGLTQIMMAIAGFTLTGKFMFGDKAKSDDPPATGKDGRPK